MASAAAPMRTLQEWMGHRDIETTQVYADYAPSAQEHAYVEAAFGAGVPTEGEGMGAVQSTAYRW